MESAAEGKETTQCAKTRIIPWKQEASGPFLNPWQFDPESHILRPGSPGIPL